MSYGLYGQWEGKSAVLLKMSTDKAYLDALLRTFRARRQFGQLSILTVTVAS